MSSFASAALCLAATACTTEAEPKDLDLSIDTVNRVAGDYTQETTALVFDFRRDPSVDQHYYILETQDGEHLMTVATAGGWRFLNVLDASFTSSGPIDGEQKSSGDPGAFSAVFEMQEMKLLEPLQRALVAHGVDAELMTMPLENVDTMLNLRMPGMGMSM